MDNKFTLERPKVDDDETEILRQQKEFLRTKQSSSVKIINSPSTPSTSSAKDPVCCTSHDVPQYANKMRLQSSNLKIFDSKRDIVSTSQDNGEIINPIINKIQESSRNKLEDAVQNIPTVSSSIILGNIVEKQFNIEKYKLDDTHIPTVSELGFPKAFESSNLKNDGKQSLFWKKISSVKNVKDDSIKTQENQFDYYSKQENTSVDLLTTEIHKENLEKLAQMSEEEILKTKKKLEETLDPNIIQFLKNKNKKSIKRSIQQDSRHDDALAVDKEHMDIEISNEKKIKLFFNVTNENNLIVSQSNTLNVPESSRKILEESKQKGWLHMDVVEPEKLEWMEDLSVEKKSELAPDECYNARFNFNGVLLPYKDENLTVDKGLHHHGEEPERPGYSLQELLQFTRSTSLQQRCVSLKTLANIMEHTQNGWYDQALDPSPLIALSQQNILLLLRFSLDEMAIPVITETLRAIRAFVYSETDEICLDKLHGFDNYTEPTLTPHIEDEIISTLKDHELVQIDSLCTLLRSDFLIRIRYILNEKHPPPTGVNYILDILIRLARHSQLVALEISSSSYLIETIFYHFLPLSTKRWEDQNALYKSYRILTAKAMKLCRILTIYGEKSVAEILNSLNIIQIILSYIASETETVDGIHTCIESLYLWRVLLHYGIGVDSIAGAQLILISRLQLLLSNHDIQNSSELACEHAAALITIASYHKELKPNITTLLAKWSTQLSSVLEPTWGVMKLVAATLCATDEISTFAATWLSNLHIFSTLRSNSNLLCDFDPIIDRRPLCVPNLDVLMGSGKLQPIVFHNSCIPLLRTVLNIFYNNNYTAQIQSLLEHRIFYKYLRDLERTEWKLERSWYSRMELELLTIIVKAAYVLGDQLNIMTGLLIWKIGIKLISALPADATDHVKQLINIVLSNEIVSLESVTNQLAKLNLSSNANQIKINVRSEAALLYERYITSDKDWNQAAMPKDWPFLPLVDIYNKCKNDIKLQLEDKNNILVVLSLILTVPHLIEKLSPSLRFSRLILLYLCDTVYLDEDISLLLTNIVSDLLKNFYANLDFKKDLPGLTSFTDLFAAICENFYSNSYGDDSFARILLIPIMQRHDAHYRKLLWSEHAAALRFLKLPLEKLIVPLKEYLYPEEEDTSLIESYITALVRGTINETWCPVPYAIAMHHSAMYLRRPNKLAVRMKRQIEKLENKDIASKLLQYIAPS